MKLKKARLKSVGCTAVLSESTSAGNTALDRAFKQLAKHAKTGQAILTICSFYDLSNKLTSLLTTLTRFHGANIDVVVLDEGWLGAQQTATLPAFVRSLAKFNRPGGRPLIFPLEEAEKLAQREEAGELLVDIADSVGISRITLWRYIKAARRARRLNSLKVRRVAKRR